MRTLKQGSIITADFPDPNGRMPATRHAAIIISRSDDVSAGLDIYVVGVSTKFDEPPPEHWVKLPFAPTGHPETGLKRACVAKCDWYVEIPQRTIHGIIGRCPPDLMKTIVTEIRKQFGFS